MNAPFEIMVPTEKPLTVEPKLAAHFLSLLFRAGDARLSVEFDAKNGVVLTGNRELKAFLFNVKL